MRQMVLVVIALLGVAACKSQDAAPTRTEPPAASAGPPAPAVPAVSTWNLDPENSSVTFVCKHVFSNVRGLFAQPAGTVTLDDANPGNSKVSATVDAKSITTGVEERDNHLRSADFFDVARFPNATFVSTGFTRSSATSYAATGNLTMHGVTRPVTLAITASAPFEHAGGIRRGIEATTTVNRRDFGLLWDFPGEGAGVVVGDTIQVTIDAELVLQAEPGKSTAGH